ncbi:FAD-dependent monooxygenase [Streptomyces chartreusis]|uniref:FAD-dependent monooxygenase n=1 Tax=Streptomyces chartreusis TaxID=1969 RepID=A0A7I0Y8W3_STRCX|nr:FAD-dependent monooxygenase [Streptomyces chartreusis]QKZ15944.1 FAD-dependent monooxygenase [Streptomyces chartreusis]
MEHSDADVDVIVVGAGPTGSALAGDLGRRGIRVLLLERTDGVVHDARLHTVNIRTMELARAWGIEQDLRNCGWPAEHPQDVVWGTSLSDPEIARIAWPSIAEMVPPAYSPTFAQRCPQKWFNPILLKFAQRQESVTVELEREATEVFDDGELVRVETVGITGADPRTYTARYVVACEGARSNIRRQLGIETIKSSVWGTSAEVIISSPDLRSIPLAQTLGRFTVVEKSGMTLSLLPFDGHDQYRITWMVGDGEITLDDMKDAARRIAGRDVEIDFLHPILPWTNRETLATTFRVGRILLAGDAAHTMPTTGGMGMNTGLGDSFDLAWKLDAVLQGWGGEALLDSYDTERRAAVVRAAGLASGIYQDWVRTREQHAQFWEHLALGRMDADEVRRELGDHIMTTFAREFNNIPGPLGYHYSDSPAVVPDGTPLPEDDLDRYTPTARPGHRAPHVWLAPGRSTLDEFGSGFTVVVASGGADLAQPLVRAASTVGMPIHVLAPIDDSVQADLRRAYERTLTLVRPDGHVAWRGERLPGNVADLVDVVRGASQVGAYAVTQAASS